MNPCWEVLCESTGTEIPTGGTKLLRILIINKGRIVADGSSETLRQQAQGQELLTIEIEPAKKDESVYKNLVALATVEKVMQIDDAQNSFRVQSKPGNSSRKPIFDLCVNKKWYLTEMTGIETKLEDVFRELTN